MVSKYPFKVQRLRIAQPSISRYLNEASLIPIVVKSQDKKSPSWVVIDQKHIDSLQCSTTSSNIDGEMMSNPLVTLLNKRSWLTSDALRLVELGANPNTQNANGQSLIHLLVNYDQKQIAEHDIAAITTLVKQYKANINAKNKEGFTALQCLINRQRWMTQNALKLVELGADPDTQDKKGQSLIHLLVTYDLDQIKEHNLEAITTLVKEYKAKINAKNKEGLTALQCLINRKKWVASDAVKLVELGADPNTQNSNGQSLIHLLINYDHRSIKYHSRRAITTLVNDYKADIHAKNKQDQTPLQCLINNPLGVYAEDALLLIGLGADPDTTNVNGDTLLHLLAASPVDQSVAIKTLIRTHKADVTIKNSAGKTAFDVSLTTITLHQNTANAYQLLKYSADFRSEIHAAVKANKLPKLLQLFSAAHEINDTKAYAFQGKIREIAFNSLKGLIKDLDAANKLEKLEWARTQPIFCSHRAHFFLERLGRTNTVCIIDKLIADIKKCNPELDKKNDSTATEMNL
jgi:ankyrin repeat protein